MRHQNGGNSAQGGRRVNPHPVKGAGRQQKHAVRLQGIGLALHQIADIAADIEIDFVFCVAVQGKVRCGLAADGMVKKGCAGFPGDDGNT